MSDTTRDIKKEEIKLQSIKAAIIDESKVLDSLTKSKNESQENHDREFRRLKKEMEDKIKEHAEKTEVMNLEIFSLEGVITPLKSEKNILEKSLIKTMDNISVEKEILKGIETSIEEKTLEFNVLVNGISSNEKEVNEIKKKIVKVNKTLRDKEEKIPGLDKKILVKKRELKKEEVKVEEAQSQLLGLSGKEKRIKELIPEIKRLYQKVGVQVDI